MEYIGAADRKNIPLPDKLKEIREKINDPDYLAAKIDEMADVLTRAIVITGRG